jgi:hypothetical protein
MPKKFLERLHVAGMEREAGIVGRLSQQVRNRSSEIVGLELWDARTQLASLAGMIVSRVKLLKNAPERFE